MLFSTAILPVNITTVLDLFVQAFPGGAAFTADIPALPLLRSFPPCLLCCSTVRIHEIKKPVSPATFKIQSNVLSAQLTGYVPAVNRLFTL